MHKVAIKKTVENIAQPGVCILMSRWLLTIYLRVLTHLTFTNLFANLNDAGAIYTYRTIKLVYTCLFSHLTISEFNLIKFYLCG